MVAEGVGAGTTRSEFPISKSLGSEDKAARVGMGVSQPGSESHREQRILPGQAPQVCLENKAPLGHPHLIAGAFPLLVGISMTPPDSFMTRPSIWIHFMDERYLVHLQCGTHGKVVAL